MSNKSPITNLRSLLGTSSVITAFFLVMFFGVWANWLSYDLFVLTLLITPAAFLLFVLVSRDMISLPKAPSTFIAIKLGHLSSGVMTVILVVLLGRPAVLTYYLSFAAASGAYLSLRYTKGREVPLISDMFVGMFGGELSEGSLILGPYLGIIGIIPVLSFFAGITAWLAILSFAVLDPTAAIVGRSWGRRRWSFNSEKTLEGSVAGFLAAALLLVPIVGILPALVISFCLSLTEAIRLPFGDNVYLPIVAAVLLTTVAA